MKILIFHAHAGDPLSFLIKALTRSQYVHAALLIDNALWSAKVASAADVTISPNERLIVEAYWPKVRARALKPAEFSEIDVFEVPTATKDVEDAAMQWVMEQLIAGTKYDVVDLFRFAAPFRAKLGEAEEDAYKKHTFCSMFVFNAYRFGGLRLLNCHDYECSPDKLDWSPFVSPLPRLS